MAKYILKRKTFSEEKKGMGLGTKLALGAAAVGGGLYAAKKGAFGANIQMKTGRGMMNLGMKNSGANTMADAAFKKASSNAKLGDTFKNMSTEEVSAWKSKTADKFKNADKLAAAKIEAKNKVSTEVAK